MLAVLVESKKAGNMTGDQIHRLAVDTQVCMIQGLVGVLGLTATDFKLTKEQLETIMSRPIFVFKPHGDRSSDNSNQYQAGFAY